ncbi:MAG: N-acetylmuramoyl-L-alanine amidase [Cyanobacteria bacterium P01_G01_bin.54]
MKFYGWFFGAIALLLCLCSPATAARLLSWEFERRDNHLIFVTDESILPQARLLSHPTRLIIDLPGVDLTEPTIQRLGGAIATIHSEQIDDENSRLIIELDANYQVDPSQIEIRGLSPTRWQVALPTPQRITLRDLPPVEPRRESTPEPNLEQPRLPSDRPTPTAQNQHLATINALEIGNNDTLLIHADRNISGRGSWNLAERAYQLLIPNARFSSRLRQPSLVGVPISQIRLRQRGTTLEILVYPSASHEVQGPEQLSSNLLSLDIVPQRIARPVPVPPTSRPTTRPTPGPLPRPTGQDLVVIDPGHGGRDPGAIGIGGLREKDVVLPISLEISRTLQQQGVRVIMTRSDDRYVTLAGRTQIANRARADVFVSIHANAISLSRPDVNGVETYYYTSGGRLAQTIHQSILSNVSIGNRGVKRARFYVLRHSSMPAVLVEVGFVTGRADAPRLANSSFRSQMAQAIARGILLYLQQN